MRIDLRRLLEHAHRFGVRRYPERCEVAGTGIDVANLGRSDDLPLGVTRGDLMPLCDVARLDPLTVRRSR